MAGKQLERRVGDAEQAANQLVDGQRRNVDAFVPRRQEDTAARLDASSAAALRSTEALDAQASRVRALLGARSGALTRPPAVQGGAEARFQAAERGHEAPATVYDTSSAARAHSDDLQERCLPLLSTDLQSLSRPGEDARRTTDQQAADRMNSEIASGWMTSDYLGGTVFGRFSAAPPVATAETGTWFAQQVAATGTPFAGRYYSGTNHVVVTVSRSEASAYKMVAHEQLHYAAYLGGGLEGMRWRGGEGEPVMRSEGWSVHEGLTELLAIQLTRAHGHNPESVAYAQETATGFIIQQAVGEEPLRRAYLSGDFTEVRGLYDGRMGAGSFDSLMACGTAPEAYSLAVQHATAAGMDTAAWASDPVMSRCRVQIELDTLR